MSDAQADFLREAVNLARSGKSAKALEVLLAHPAPDGHSTSGLYHYTLGNLLFESGNPGRALAHLEKARKLSSSSQNLEALLSAAKSRAASAAGTEALDRALLPIERFTEHPLFLPLESCLSIIALLSSWSLWRNRSRSEAKQITLLAACIWWVAAVTMLGMHFWSLRHPPGRLIAATELRSGPGVDFLLSGNFPAGTEVRILSSLNSDWTQVRVAPSVQGWIPSGNLLPLTTDSTTRN
ncbi:MAG: hypothetical protein ACK5QT_03160 [Oligoflexia bacterium]